MTNFLATLASAQGASPWYTLWTTLLSMLDSTFAALVATGYTSETAITIGTGSRTFTVDQATTNLATGQVLAVFSISGRGNLMVGDVTAVSTTTVSINVRSTGGSGSHSDWCLVPAASIPPYRAVSAQTANYSVQSSDLGALIDVTANSPTITLPAPTAAAIGSGFAIGVINTGSGVVTVAVSGGALIDGVSSVVLLAGQAIECICDGTGFRIVAAKGYGWLGGGATVTASMAADLVLTSTSTRLQQITPTADFLSVKLPDATTMTGLGTAFVIQNTTTRAVAIRDTGGNLLASIDGAGTAEVFLAANGTANGSWVVTGPHVAEVHLAWQQGVASGYTYDSAIVLASNAVVLFFHNASGALYAQAFDPTTKTAGTLTLVESTASSSYKKYFAVSSTQAFLYYSKGASSPTFVVLTLSGTTISVGTSVSDAQVASGSVGGIVYQASGSVFVVGAFSGANCFLKAITVSGSTVTIGSASANLSTTLSGTQPGFVVCFASATAGMVIVQNYNGSTTVNSGWVPFTLSGTSFTFGTGVSTGVLSGTYYPIDPNVLFLTATTGVVQETPNSATSTVYTTAFSLSGLAVTFGTPVSDNVGTTLTKIPTVTAVSATEFVYSSMSTTFRDVTISGTVVTLNVSTGVAGTLLDLGDPDGLVTVTGTNGNSLKTWHRVSGANATMGQLPGPMGSKADSSAFAKNTTGKGTMFWLASGAGGVQAVDYANGHIDQRGQVGFKGMDNISSINGATGIDSVRSVLCASTQTGYASPTFVNFYERAA